MSIELPEGLLERAVKLYDAALKESETLPVDSKACALAVVLSVGMAAEHKRISSILDRHLTQAARHPSKWDMLQDLKSAIKPVRDV